MHSYKRHCTYSKLTDAKNSTDVSNLQQMFQLFANKNSYTNPKYKISDLTLSQLLKPKTTKASNSLHKIRQNVL